jgi:hypothetical protein
MLENEFRLKKQVFARHYYELLAKKQKEATRAAKVCTVRVPFLPSISSSAGTKFHPPKSYS